METYKQMLQSRPQIDEVTWQREALLDKDILTKKKVVVAAGTSSGKSLFMTMLLEQFYLNEDNKTKQSLFIPSGQTNLRLNIQDTFEFFKPTFSYVIAENCDELQAAIDNGTQVIVCLPQSVARCMDSLNKLDKFILDEAHTWYF
jgi:replicative superfamily II helicase